ncbi:MarP family serine protease [Okibacterium endophyticum]
MPTTSAVVIDVVLAVVLLVALLYGYSRGLLRIAGGLVGMIAGAIAAFFLLPLVATWAPLAGWRVAVSIGIGLLLITIGYSIGVAITNLVRRPLHKTPLRVVDRVLGAIANTVVTLAVLSVLAFSTASLGIPALTQAVASSTILRTLDTLTPTPVDSFLAQLRSTILNDGVPRVLEAVGIPDTAPEAPGALADNAALRAASESVVRITGNAPACGTGSVGSGFVIGDERVLTNAHVLAGVTELVVEAPGEFPRTGEIVYFDPVDDLAVIEVPGLDEAALPATTTLPPETDAAFLGYPYGGPFSAKGATVLSSGPTIMGDIYGQNPAPRQVTTLAADVQHGNSGGPLLTLDGAVAGVIFAKSDVAANVGYALAMEEVLPVIAQAESLTEPVASGACVS